MQLSSEPFEKLVDRALTNPGRLAAIRRAADRFYEHRLAAVNAMPDADAARDHARAIRAHTIAHLDRYLQQFEEALTAIGGRVHWARDAAEARRIVLEIAARTGTKSVVKSKSMLSEEVGINRALEGAGIRVYETDLGEYIAQLGKDSPSHLIAPVLHLTRQEVGEIFARTLDAPYTDNIGELNDIARTTLREAFLNADMGISGCNLAVAETGTICLVTNEGNGRMVTTLPRVHVALMGMERIVPTLDDLAAMLRVLARSATGQKMSVYTSLVTGPRRPDEQHGPEEVHVIIVDNGRSQALTTEMAEILYCIRCGACLNACPVYRAVGGHAYGSVYSGPVGSVVSPVLGGIPAFPDLPHASTLCGACRDVCPVRIDLPRLLLELRHQTVKAGYSPGWLKTGMQLYTGAAVRPQRFRWLARWAARLTGGRWREWLPPPLTAWTRFRAFPPFARKTFQEQQEEKTQ